MLSETQFSLPAPAEPETKSYTWAGPKGEQNRQKPRFYQNTNPEPEPSFKQRSDVFCLLPDRCAAPPDPGSARLQEQV